MFKEVVQPCFLLYLYYLYDISVSTMCIYCDYCVYHYKSTELVSLYTLDIGLKINIIIIKLHGISE